jgi:hypothetical protein
VKGRAVLSFLAIVAVVAILLSVAQLFVLFADALPVRSLPQYPSDDESLNALNNYQRGLAAFAPYQSDLITAWGLSILAAVVAVWGASHYGPGAMRKVLKGSVLVASSVCFAFYLSLAGATSGVLQFGFPFTGDLVAWLRPTMEWGYLAFVAFCISVGGLVLGIRSLGRSWPASMRGALAIFGVPGVLFLEVGLLLYSPSNMFAYVITHARFTLGNNYLLSNWNVLYSALMIGAMVYGSFGISMLRKHWK